jgi:heme exporter protein B
VKDYVRAIGTIVHKDAIVELRTRETLLASLIFTLLVVVVFAFALELAPATARAVAPGLLWVTLAFAGVLALGRSFAAERDRGALDGLLLAPVDPTALYVGKMLANLVFMVAVLVVALPAFSILLGVPLLSLALLPSALLGLLGFAAAGTLFSALALHGRAREVLLPALFLPLAIPVIITAAGAMRLDAAGAPSGSAVGVLVACDALYLAVAVLLFGYTIEE